MCHFIKGRNVNWSKTGKESILVQEARKVLEGKSWGVRGPLAPMSQGTP
jgi:hypothetical protein